MEQPGSVPGSNDVKLGQGKSRDRRDANERYRALLNKHRKTRYREAMDKMCMRTKQKIVQEVVNDLLFRNSRVFHQGAGENTWHEDVGKKLQSTIAEALRAGTRKSKNTAKRPRKDEAVDDPCFVAYLQSIANGDLEVTTSQQSTACSESHIFISANPPLLRPCLAAIAGHFYESAATRIQQKLEQDDAGRELFRRRSFTAV